MSELIHKNDNRATIRWKLLTSASAAAVIAYTASIGLARADDNSDRPLIWVQLSSVTDMMQGASGTFTAPFFDYPTSTYNALVTAGSNVSGGTSIYGNRSFGWKQAPTRFSLGGDAKIIFQPQDSDWLFSAELRYGRSHTNKHTHYQGPVLFNSIVPKYAAAFSDTLLRQKQSYTIADFQAGKDVGLGLLGNDGVSTVSAGVRFAQFSTKSSMHISARPFVNQQSPYVAVATFDQYVLSGHQARSFKGVGPSISWDASAAIAGNRDRGELTVDWGVSGSILFGRQKAKTDHKTSGRYYEYGYHALYPARTYDAPLRSKRVTVPELSGFIGLSAKLPNSKISIGYRGDIWFKAMDTGIDARKTSSLTFNGPYASISIGLGD